MSVKVTGTTIIMTRGDTLKLQIIIQNGNDIYQPVEGDVIRFAAKKDYDDEMPCILKDIPYNTCELHLEPQDTKHLEQPCTLLYDVEITMNDGTVDTFMTGKLKITEEVH